MRKSPSITPPRRDKVKKKTPPKRRRSTEMIHEHAIHDGDSATGDSSRHPIGYGISLKARLGVDSSRFVVRPKLATHADQITSRAVWIAAREGNMAC